MGNSRTVKLDTIMNQVLPFVLPCPRSMALDSLCVVAKDFCTQAAIWKEVFSEQGYKGNTSIDIPVPIYAEIVKVTDLWIGESCVCGDQYHRDGKSLHLHFAMPHDEVVSARCWLRPSREYQCLPDWLIEEWGDVIAYGAQARLKVMTGNKIEWSDAAGAQVALEQYNEGVARARIRAMRRN